MKHSPAPWRLKYGNMIVDARNETIACDLHLGLNPADAALIAAAPDMLEVLKALAKYDDEMYRMDSYYAMDAAFRETLNEVIAKAEGNVLTQTETI